MSPRSASFATSPTPSARAAVTSRAACRALPAAAPEPAASRRRACAPCARHDGTGDRALASYAIRRLLGRRARERPRAPPSCTGHVPSGLLQPARGLVETRAPRRPLMGQRPPPDSRVGRHATDREGRYRGPHRETGQGLAARMADSRAANPGLGLPRAGLFKRLGHAHSIFRRGGGQRAGSRWRRSRTRGLGATLIASPADGGQRFDIRICKAKARRCSSIHERLESTGRRRAFDGVLPVARSGTRVERPRLARRHARRRAALPVRARARA